MLHYSGDMVKKAAASTTPKDAGTRRPIVWHVPETAAAPGDEPQAEIREQARAQGYAVGHRGWVPIVVYGGAKSDEWLVGLFEDAGDDHQRGLVRLVRGRLQHQERVAANFDALVVAMMPSLFETDVVPAAMVAQARRRAELRSKLLASGALQSTRPRPTAAL